MNKCNPCHPKLNTILHPVSKTQIPTSYPIGTHKTKLNLNLNNMVHINQANSIMLHNININFKMDHKETFGVIMLTIHPTK